MVEGMALTVLASNPNSTGSWVCTLGAQNSFRAYFLICNMGTAHWRGAIIMIGLDDEMHVKTPDR